MSNLHRSYAVGGLHSVRLTWSAALLGIALSGCGDSPARTSSRGGPDAEVGDGGSEEDGAVTDEPPTTDAKSQAVEDLFATWSEMRAAIRQSPDHLPARAERLVQAREVEEIFAFVRDEIVAVPGAAAAISPWVSNGTRATLRSGVGSLWDKSQLLAWMLGETGMEAEVVSGTADTARVNIDSVFLRTYAERKFAPPATADDLARWKRHLDVQAMMEPGSAPDTRRDDLARALLEVLPTSAQARSFDRTVASVPAVRYRKTRTEPWTYLNPLVADAQLGESLLTGTPAKAGEPPRRRVRVRLEAAREDAPRTRFELLSGDFDLEDVIGRRVRLAFAPPVSMRQFMNMSLRDLDALVPIMGVEAADLSSDERDRLRASGDLITLGGERFEDGPDGVRVVGGDVLGASSDPGAAERVAQVALTTRSRSFPQVSLHVDAADAAGADVAGLGPAAFSVRDNGELVSFHLVRDDAPPPSVVMLFDLSTSIPPEFRDQGAVTVASQIVDGLYAALPNVRVHVRAVGDTAPNPVWASSREAARAQAAELAGRGGTSALWRALADANRMLPTAIVLFSDGKADDGAEQIALARPRIAVGAPVHALRVGSGTDTVLTEQTTLSGGSLVPVMQQAEAVSTVLATLGKAPPEARYELRYTAPSGSGSHDVVVTAGGVQAKATYQVDSSPTPVGFSALWLTTDITGQPSRPLLLAGNEDPAEPVTADEVEAVRGILRGSITLGVEADGPTLAVALDEWLSERLAMRPVFEASDEEALADALDDGVNPTPLELRMLARPLPRGDGEGVLTYATQPRVGAAIHSVSLTGGVVRRMDLSPSSQWSTLVPTPREAYERTLRATLSLALTEADALRGSSTFEALQGQTLLLAVEPPDAWPSAARARFIALRSAFGSEYDFVIGERPDGYWAVQRSTGTVIGLLPDLTGGAREVACANYNLYNAVLNLAGLLGTLTGAPVAGWGAIGAWEVKNVTIATIVIGAGCDCGRGGTPEANAVSDPRWEIGCTLITDQILSRGGEAPWRFIRDLAAAIGLLDSTTTTAGTAGLVAHPPTLCDFAGSGSICE